MSRALMVAYQFPPVGGAGVQRVAKFVKYLDRFGWGCDALSVLNPSVPLVDQSLVRDIPSDVTVFRSRTLEPSYAVKSSLISADAGTRTWKSRVVGPLKKMVSQFLLPDAQVLWWPHTVLLLRRLLKEGRYQVVFVTGPPFSTFFLTVVLAKWYGIPAVLDYRDEWSFSRENWENLAKSRLARRVDTWMERYVLRNCAAVTVASPCYERSMKEAFPFVAQRIWTITNGYDPSDFEAVRPYDAPHQAGDQITILYTGTVWKATSFQGFLEGVRIMAKEDAAALRRVRMRVIGRVVQEELAVIEELGRYLLLERLDYLPHEQILPEMAAADLLLLTLADVPGAEKIIPGKAFEYLATPVPVLAVVPEGITAELVAPEQEVFVAAPGDPRAVVEALQAVLRTPRRGVPRQGIERYSRLQLTRELVKVFDMVAAPNHCS